MSRLECVGKSSTGPQKQLAEEVISAHAQTHKPNDNSGEKTITDKPRSFPARALPRSVQIQKSGLPSGGVLDTDECSPVETINIIPRVEQTQWIAVPDEELNMKDVRKAEPSHSTLTGATRSPPPAEPLPTHEPNGEEEDAEDEDIQAPVELIMKFLRALIDREFQLASKLCRMILIYEPDNPEASEFLPLIQKKLLEEEEAEQSTEEDEEEEEDDDDDDDSDESGSDEESPECPSCSTLPRSSSSSSPSVDDEEEKQVNRHELCPASFISP